LGEQLFWWLPKAHCILMLGICLLRDLLALMNGKGS